MKELIEESYKFSKRLGDENSALFALHIVKWIVALKAAEAREAELRARVKELEGFGHINHPNACRLCGEPEGHNNLPCPSYMQAMEIGI